MKTGPSLSHKTSSALVTATRPWIKAVQSLMQGPLDRRVITDLKMKTIDVFLTPPVAPPEMGLILYAKRHRYRLNRISAVGTKQHHMLRQSGVNQSIKNVL